MSSIKHRNFSRVRKLNKTCRSIICREAKEEYFCSFGSATNYTLDTTVTSSVVLCVIHKTQPVEFISRVRKLNKQVEAYFVEEPRRIIFHDTRKERKEKKSWRRML